MGKPKLTFADSSPAKEPEPVLEDEVVEDISADEFSVEVDDPSVIVPPPAAAPAPVIVKPVAAAAPAPAAPVNAPVEIHKLKPDELEAIAIRDFATREKVRKDREVCINKPPYAPTENEKRILRDPEATPNKPPKPPSRRPVDSEFCPNKPPRVPQAKG